MASHCIDVGVWPPMQGMAFHLEYGLPYREGGVWPPIVLVVARRGRDLQACIFVQDTLALPVLF